ncbi:MAG: nucleotide exchange factor GrpE [Desulfobacterales bacterium]
MTEENMPEDNDLAKKSEDPPAEEEMQSDCDAFMAEEDEAAGPVAFENADDEAVDVDETDETASLFGDEAIQVDAPPSCGESPVGPEAAAGPDDILTSIENRLEAVEACLDGLSQDFEGKLKYDAHKEMIIDRLHGELQDYKQDLLKKLVLSFILDVIKLADDIRKWIAHFKALEPSQRDPVKLFRYLEAIPSDLEDIFYWQGVKPYSTSDGAFDPIRQRALKKVPTDDPHLDKTVSHSLRPGYEWDGKVIRQEMVAVYVHSDESK